MKHKIQLLKWLTGKKKHNTVCMLQLLCDRKQNSTAENHLLFQGHVPAYRVVVFVTTNELAMQCSFICGDIH